MSLSNEKMDFQKSVVKLLMNISQKLEAIHSTLRATDKELDDQDIEDMAVHYLIQCGPNLSEIVRKMAGQGVPIRRQSLTEAKKFSRFREKLNVFKSGKPRAGFATTDGDVEAID